MTKEGSAVHSRGENVTYYLAWEHMDLSHPSNRYRDEPEQKDYDWAKWRMNIVSGVAVAAALVAGGVGLLAGAGASAGGGAAVGTAAGAANATGMAVFLTGSLYVAEQAVSDAMSGRLSETEQYARKALAGSVVGFLTGASGLLMQGSGLGKVLAIGFGEGFLGSAATQALLNEDGEINWALAFGEGMFSAAVTGMAWEIGGSIKSIEGGSKSGTSSISNQKPDLYHYTDANGARAIQESGMIKTDSRGRVFVTTDEIRPQDANNALFMGVKGDDCATHRVEINLIDPNDVNLTTNGVTQPNELIYLGTLRNGKNANFI